MGEDLTKNEGKLYMWRCCDYGEYVHHLAEGHPKDRQEMPDNLHIQRQQCSQRCTHPMSGLEFGSHQNPPVKRAKLPQPETPYPSKFWKLKDWESKCCQICRP